MSDHGHGDFEFERRFYVRSVPQHLLDAPTLIVQAYYLAAEGYALRLRVQATGLGADLSAVRTRADELALLHAHAADLDFCAVTVKGPMIGGTRYEAEREIDIVVGVEMLRRGGLRVVKNRHPLWLGEDGWVVDVFAGANRPLVIAEVERGGPVTDLTIPDFCTSEVTEDARFANDALAVAPFSGWAGEFADELAGGGPRFAAGFGRNRHGEP